MRISDWSSDVCSSDLHVLPGVPQRRVAHHLYAEDGDISGEIEILPQGEMRLPQERDYLTGLSNRRAAQKWIAQRLEGQEGTVLILLSISQRSEEHTSELQSLMRISYAVFCLKKKNNKQHTTNQT